MNTNTGKMKRYESLSGNDLSVSTDSRTFLENRLHNFFLSRLGELMPGFLHNLGNPLSVILGNAELLAMTYEKDIVHDIVTMATDIKFEIKKLQKILHTIMGTGSRYMTLRDAILTQIQILRNDLTFKHKMNLQSNLNPDNSDYLVPALPASAMFAIIFKNIITDFRIKSELEGLESLELKLVCDNNECRKIRLYSSHRIEFIDEQDDLLPMVMKYIDCRHEISYNDDGSTELTLFFESEDA